MRILSVTAVRNEGPFLLEWIAFHRLIGVTDFLIYSNDCDDGTDLLLDALQAAGIVTHQPHSCPPDKSIQWQALNSAWRHDLRRQADWLLFSDVDEFPLVRCGSGRLPDLIAALPTGADAVTLPWRLFGAGGIAGFRDSPVIGQFNRSAPPALYHPVAGTMFKTLLRPAAFRKLGVHRPKLKAEGPLPLWCDGSGAPLPETFLRAEGRLSLLGLSEGMAGRALVELHHYSLRSAESFLAKRHRGLANRKTRSIDLDYWISRNFNTVQNTAMAPWVAPVQAEMARLAALPGVGDLHRQSCDRHRATIAAQLGDAAGLRLFSACLHAADSAVLSRRQAMALYARFQKLGAA